MQAINLENNLVLEIVKSGNFDQKPPLPENRNQVLIITGKDTRSFDAMKSSDPGFLGPEIYWWCYNQTLDLAENSNWVIIQHGNNK